jgi:ACT domain-containing protein
MRAVVTVVGKDKPGIVAKISAALFENGANIIDIQQNVLKDMFAMIVLVDISGCKAGCQGLAKALDKAGEELQMKVHTMHEDIFNAMHRI